MNRQAWRNPNTAQRCDRKKSYPSERFAGKVAFHASVRARTPILPYQCPDCGKWHIGRPPLAQRGEMQRLLDSVLIEFQNRRRAREEFLARVQFTILVVPEKPDTTSRWLPRTGRLVQPLSQPDLPRYSKVHEIRPAPVVQAKPEAAKYDISIGDRRGHMIVEGFAQGGRLQCRCDCGQVEQRRRCKWGKHVVRTGIPAACRECTDVATMLRDAFWEETGFFLASESFFGAALRFTLGAAVFLERAA